MSNKKEIGLGKLPPQALDLEEAVLGAIMLEKEALPSISDILTVESFYKEANQKIYKACLRLNDRSEPVDIMTVTQELREMETLKAVGGAFYVTQLTNRVNSAANIEYHCRIIQENFLRRELIRVGAQTETQAYKEGEDVFKTIETTEKELFKIGNHTSTKGHTTIRKSMIEVLKELEDKKNKPQELGGLESGLANLDKITGGFQKSDLIIIAARPGMGKTALALTMARNAAVDFNKKIAVFSLEMTTKQLTVRLLATETGIENEKLRQGRVTDKEFNSIHNKIGRLVDSGLYIDDTESLQIRDFRSKARRLKQQFNIDAIVVDYLQLMTTPFSGTGNRTEEIGHISSTLKSVAKELDIPVIALSQLSRAVESRSDKRPQLSDLRESGSIEQDADLVMFLFRPSYYGITDVTDIETGQPMDKTATKLIIAKHRNGSLEDVNLSFKAELTKFEEYSFYGAANGLTPVGQTANDKAADDYFNN